MDDQEKSFREYLAIFKRRKRSILTTFSLLFLLSLVIATMWPPVYRSTATILIEEQEIPSDLVRSTITTYADQRIETIKQHVLSRPTLMKIVEQLNLYPKLTKNSPTETIVERFIKDIQVEVINAKVVDKRTQNPTQATIAFTLSYDGESPEIAQKVANEITTLFLNENLKTRERRAQETTAFLRQESDNLERHLEDLETKISKVKEKASGALPELVQMNMQLLNQADRELMDVDREVRSLEERKTYLEGELATLKPNTPIISASGERILDAGERLKALQAQYVSMAAYLSPDHPDVQKAKREIAALERETGGSAGVSEIAKRLSGERATLAGLLERYGSEHPDVVRSRTLIQSLEAELKKAPQTAPKPKSLKPENPAYINIDSQLASATASLQALKATRGGIKRRVEEYTRRLEKTPHVEPEYLDLVRDRDTSTHKYQEIRSRLFEAQVSEGLEVQRKGERFSLIDPPDLPQKPEKPNRPAIAILGLALAAAGGFGIGAAGESLDHSIRDADHLAQLTQAFPLAVIPYMRNETDQRRLNRRTRLLRWGGVSVIVAALTACHFLWTPLDVLWYAALRKFGIGE